MRVFHVDTFCIVNPLVDIESKFFLTLVNKITGIDLLPSKRGRRLEPHANVQCCLIVSTFQIISYTNVFFVQLQTLVPQYHRMDI